MVGITRSKVIFLVFFSFFKVWSLTTPCPPVVSLPLYHLQRSFHGVRMAEIRRSPVEVGSLSHYLQGFIHPRWCRISAINSRILKGGVVIPLIFPKVLQSCLRILRVPQLPPPLGHPGTIKNPIINGGLYYPVVQGIIMSHCKDSYKPTNPKNPFVCPKNPGISRSIPILFGWDWEPENPNQRSGGVWILRVI